MVRITVNGHPEFIGFAALSYEQILGIVNTRRADRRLQPATSLHTVVFSYPDVVGGKRSSGTLAPGQSVSVRDEMAIVAIITANA